MPEFNHPEFYLYEESKFFYLSSSHYPYCHTLERKFLKQHRSQMKD